MIDTKKDTNETPAKQGADAVDSEPNKIGAATPYDFEGENLTAYGGLLPVATMLERLRFQQLVEETLTVKRVTRAMSMYQFVLAMVMAAYVGLSSDPSCCHRVCRRNCPRADAWGYIGAMEYLS